MFKESTIQWRRLSEHEPTFDERKLFCTNFFNMYDEIDKLIDRVLHSSTDFSEVVYTSKQRFYDRIRLRESILEDYDWHYHDSVFVGQLYFLFRDGTAMDFDLLCVGKYNMQDVYSEICRLKDELSDSFLVERHYCDDEDRPSYETIWVIDAPKERVWWADIYDIELPCDKEFDDD